MWQLDGMNPIYNLVLSVIAVSLAMAVMVLLVLRHRAYRRWLNYSPRQNAVARFRGDVVQALPINATAGGWVMPDTANGAVSGFLEVDARATVMGRFCDPWIELVARGFYDVQFLERGVCGVRFLNITRLLAAGVAPGETIELRGHGVALRLEFARLHLSREMLQASDRVIIIAPHPDDAEIMAFGLYTDTGATVVNITTGDASNRYRSSGRLAMRVPRATVARVRVWDSITIPQLFGVKPEQAVNLCYSDGCLAEMRLQPERDFRGDGADALDFEGLRQLNRSTLVREGAKCTWVSLVRDLEHILAATRPTIIVMPHPLLDPHPDHMATTAAVAEALRGAGLGDGRFLFYCTHNRRSELWPFGPAGSGVPLLPLLESDGPCSDGFYSHVLSAERQTEKFLALEAMHDVRDMAWPVASPTEGAGRRLCAELRALAHGMGRTPLNYFRQAVRPDELFLTASFANGLELCARTGGCD